MSKLLLASEAGRRLKLSASGVRRYDGRLQPERTSGGVRLYREDAVDELAREREERKGDGE